MTFADLSIGWYFITETSVRSPMHSVWKKTGDDAAFNITYSTADHKFFSNEEVVLLDETLMHRGPK